MRVLIRNNEDTISMLRTAEAALQTVTNILQRMRDLAVQSATGTNSDENRNFLDKEFQALSEQIDYINKVTEFNDIPQFDEKGLPIILHDTTYTIRSTKQAPLSQNKRTSRFQQNKKQKQQLIKLKTHCTTYYCIVLISVP